MTDTAFRKSLLLVDDDPSIRLMMSRSLTSLDLRLIEACSGEEAIEQFKIYRPDMVLLDVSMLMMDGFQCCRELRQLPGGTEVAIVMVTALDRPEDIELAFEAGATDFMTKPLKWPLFNHRVRYILKANDNLLELTRSQTKLARAQTIAHLGYWEWDFKNNLDFSENLVKMLDLNREKIDFDLKSALRYVVNEDRQFFFKAIKALIQNKQPYDIEYRLRKDDGSIMTVHDRTELIETSGEWRVIGALHDITQRKKTEQEITYYAFFDTLTELPNRRLFLEQLATAISAAERRKEKLCLMFIDLDHFKEVNDSFGHLVGDELLRQAAKRIKDCVRVTDLVAVAASKESSNKVARLAGDEFTVLLCEVSMLGNVAVIAQRLIDAFNVPFELKGYEVYISVSIGIAWYPADGADVQTLIQHADIAMYHAKEEGRNNFKFFDEKMNSYLRKRLQLEAELRDAIKSKQFVLYYQPQFDALNENLIGFEALLRWRHPENGILTPYEFINVAEENGMIVEIGEWVLNEACKQAAIWQSQYEKNFRIAVNLSALQFSHDHLPAQVKSALDESGLEPGLLELEITETALVKDIAETISLLFTLKKLGVKLAIDDFGSGYSSLNYLKNFPIDTLKIDKSFVDEIVTSERDAAIALTIVELGKNLGLSTIAEGVETMEQKQSLKQMGCCEFQGYFFSKPMSIDKVSELMRNAN